MGEVFLAFESEEANLLVRNGGEFESTFDEGFG